jgi:hypothetical protein
MAVRPKVDRKNAAKRTGGDRMTATTMVRVYEDDVEWLNELRRKLSTEQHRDVPMAECVHALRLAYERTQEEAKA